MISTGGLTKIFEALTRNVGQSLWFEFTEQGTKINECTLLKTLGMTVDTTPTSLKIWQVASAWNKAHTERAESRACSTARTAALKPRQETGSILESGNGTLANRSVTPKPLHKVGRYNKVGSLAVPPCPLYRGFLKKIQSLLE